LFATGINNTSETGGKICRRVVDTSGKFATGVVDTGGNFAAGVIDTGLQEFSKKFQTVRMGYSEAGGKLIHEKNQKQIIS
jgi:hypothetical protein